MYNLTDVQVMYLMGKIGNRRSVCGLSSLQWTDYKELVSEGFVIYEDHYNQITFKGVWMLFLYKENQIRTTRDINELLLS